MQRGSASRRLTRYPDGAEACKVVENGTLLLFVGCGIAGLYLTWAASSEKDCIAVD